MMVAGNWKMHGTRVSVAKLIAGLRDLPLSGKVGVVVFPPDLFIDRVVEGLKDKPILIGAQDTAVEEKEGALTGETSSGQLRDAGCALVLVGHSERRLLLGESGQTLNRKFAAVQASGLTPVLCIGETLKQREVGQALEAVVCQLNVVIDALGIEVLLSTVIAYEPVWAIGTGLTASPQQAQDMHAAIRAWLAKKSPEVASGVRLLYGGSVRASNAVELFSMPDIDGGLVGGASLDADEFGSIVRAAGN